MKKNAIIEPLQHIFDIFQLEEEADIIKDLSKHNSDEQEKIFNAFREIFQDEMRFVMVLYQAHLNGYNIEGHTSLSAN
ncbi:MAG TPA: hypothetical protein VNM69_02240 [Bacillus sp. (in: firmicutes)]|nr:hypothetical protein [Bacillus sp. (in: firmicutes)]